jgi:hypothetical protein
MLLVSKPIINSPQPQNDEFVQIDHCVDDQGFTLTPVTKKQRLETFAEKIRQQLRENPLYIPNDQEDEDRD